MYFNLMPARKLRILIARNAHAYQVEANDEEGQGKPMTSSQLILAQTMNNTQKTNLTGIHM